MDIKKKSVMYGAFAIVIVVLFNFLILSLLGFPLMATEIIRKYFILFVLLIGGFGLQVGLFVYHRSMISCSTTVVSGGVSAISMILCCSHYILNILPFLGAVVGISGLAVLADYTLHFLILGIVSNAIGIGVIYYQVKKKGVNTLKGTSK